MVEGEISTARGAMRMSVDHGVRDGGARLTFLLERRHEGTRLERCALRHAHGAIGVNDGVDQVDAIIEDANARAFA